MGFVVVIYDEQALENTTDILKNLIYNSRKQAMMAMYLCQINDYIECTGGILLENSCTGSQAVIGFLRTVIYNDTIGYWDQEDENFPSDLEVTDAQLIEIFERKDQDKKSELHSLSMLFKKAEGGADRVEVLEELATQHATPLVDEESRCDYRVYTVDGTPFERGQEASLLICSTHGDILRSSHSVQLALGDKPCSLDFEGFEVQVSYQGEGISTAIKLLLHGMCTAFYHHVKDEDEPVLEKLFAALQSPGFRFDDLIQNLEEHKGPLAQLCRNMGTNTGNLENLLQWSMDISEKFHHPCDLFPSTVYLYQEKCTVDNQNGSTKRKRVE